MSSLPRRLPYVRLGKEDDSIISSNLPFQKKKKKKKLLYLLFRFCRTSRISIIFSRSIWIIVVIFWKLKNRKISSQILISRSFSFVFGRVESDLNRIFGKKEEERELKTASETW